MFQAPGPRPLADCALGDFGGRPWPSGEQLLLGDLAGGGDLVPAAGLSSLSGAPKPGRRVAAEGGGVPGGGALPGQ